MSTDLYSWYSDLQGITIWKTNAQKGVYTVFSIDTHTAHHAVCTAKQTDSQPTV